MAALNFPSSPTLNQTYTANGSTWQWDGATWKTANLVSSSDVTNALGYTPQPSDGDLTSIAGLTGTSGILIKTAANTWSLDTNTYLTTSAASTTYQPLDGDLTAIAALSTTGFLKRTGTNTWTLDTNTYLTAEADTLATVTGRGATTSTAVTLSGGATVGGTGIVYSGSTSGTTTLKAAAAAGTTTITMPATTGTMALTADIPTVSNGTLTLSIGAAAATNNTVTVGTGTGFSANTATNSTYSLSVGPALTALASTMTGVSTGFLKKTAADTYALDTSTYLTGVAITNDTTTATALYPTLTSATTGSVTGESVSSTKLSFIPSTGVLSATGFSGSGASLTSLTAGNLTGTIPSAVLGNSTHYIGTTAITLNRASAAQALTGITSIDGDASGITGGVANQILYQTGPGTTSFITAPVTTGTYLQWNGTAFVWATPSASSGVSSFSAGTTGLTPNTATTGAVTLAGTLALANGGTNASITAVNGGVAYSTATALAVTAAGTSGQALVSAGAAAPVWTTLTLANLPGAWTKKAVDVATTAALTLNTAQTTIDGVTISATSRVLVKDQATASQNGIYTNVTTTTWTRAADAAASGDIAGGTVSVDQGTVNGGRIYHTTFKSTDTLGTTAMTWNQVLDASTTVPAANLSGTIPSTVLGNSSLFLGTTLIALNRASAAIALTGITSIDGYAADVGGGVANQILYQTAANTTSYITAPTVTGTYLQWNGTAFAWATPSAGVTSISFGTTGLTPSTATSGAVTVAGTLAIANGGTGATTAAAALTNLGAAPTASPTFTGIGTFGGAMRETRSAISASAIDLSLGNFFTKTIAAATTFTVSNVPVAGTAASFILDLTNGGAFTVTWWTGVKWTSGVAPTLTASGRDVLGFFTHDGGTTWTGLVLGKDVK